MKTVLMILGAIVLSSTIALAATATGTDGIVCYSGGTPVFTDPTVNVPVIVAPETFGDPNDLYTATDSATGVQTTVGGSGTVCVVTFTPTSSSSSSKSTAVHPGLTNKP